MSDERGLNRLEVTVALLHALALAIVTSVVAAEVFREARDQLGPVLAGAFVAASLELLELAANRAPRARLTAGARIEIALSGLCAGVLGLPVLRVVLEGRF